MDFLTKYKRQVALRSFIGNTVTLLIALLSWYISQEIVGLAAYIAVAVALVVGLICSFIASSLVTESSTKPMTVLESIISYASNNQRDGQPLALESLSVGRELVTAQSLQIYDLASITSVTSAQSTSSVSSISGPSVIDGVPLPIIGTDSQGKITISNKAFSEYLGQSPDSIIGKDLNDVLNLNFQESETLDIWLDKVSQTAVTATRTWDYVRHVIDDDKHKQFDMAASFSSGSHSGTDMMLAIFDHTNKYNQNDQDISFVALAVHELRTPLTIMRGYIEVFEDELGATLTPELTDFMHKMHASSERLAAFVSNILNVARVEENQLSLKLKEENWSDILKSAIDDLQLRASVHGIQIEMSIADNLPSVGADRISMHEVVNNLIDNAIKYSGDSKKIVITTQLNSQNVVETSVQDFGIGIPESVIKNLFQKYHRSHTTSNQIKGTGLGLYLCKALVSAHGGNIWVRSKAGEGSIFSFTLLPYDQISKEQSAGEDGIIREAHGWIKNHSLYRN